MSKVSVMVRKDYSHRDSVVQTYTHAAVFDTETGIVKLHQRFPSSDEALVASVNLTMVLNSGIEVPVTNRMAVDKNNYMHRLADQFVLITDEEEDSDVKNPG